MLCICPLRSHVTVFQLKALVLSISDSSRNKLPAAAQAADPAIHSNWCKSLELIYSP